MPSPCRSMRAANFSNGARRCHCKALHHPSKNFRAHTSLRYSQSWANCSFFWPLMKGRSVLRRAHGVPRVVQLPQAENVARALGENTPRVAVREHMLATGCGHPATSPFLHATRAQLRSSVYSHRRCGVDHNSCATIARYRISRGCGTMEPSARRCLMMTSGTTSRYGVPDEASKPNPLRSAAVSEKGSAAARFTV